ncbi:hypothetical protein [Croceivirga lutea]|uniref:hypothetical protein n=1 Tax=Croceivirga lutea TaxID=1775167 RepID=UPI0016398501|nr:hypothetical protein [Croceivirga lutea]
MMKFYGCILSFLLISLSFQAQEISTLSTKDFDLNGQVKTCTVVTDYGRELFEFTKDGKLTKIVTQYNEEDQDITHFVFTNNLLIEKRVESYKNGKIDMKTSMGNFYEYDTTGTQPKIVEKIISYDKAFFEKQEHLLNENGDIFKIIVSHEDGVDEKRIEKSEYKGESTTTYFTNEVIEKSVRVSSQKLKSGKTLKIELTKDFVDGQPSEAKELRYAENGNLLSEEQFIFDTKTEQFASEIKRTFVYNKEGVLEKEIIQRQNSKSEKGYIFQYDANLQPNWVKKIITPDNSFVTRIIEYYEDQSADIKVE